MTSALRVVIAVIAVAGAACTEFETIDRGICGNGLIEPGEDCDSSASTCVRCAVVCMTKDTCPSPDYECGADGLCYAPGGALDQGEPAGPFQVNEVAITDLDDDGIGDAVGVSRTSIAVRYGDPGARLTRSESLITPAQTGTPAFVNLDGDDALDLTIATDDGLVAYTSKFGGLAPLAVATPIVDEMGSGGVLDFRFFYEMGPLSAGGFIADGASGNMYAVVFEFNGQAAFAAPCLARLGPIQVSTFSPKSVDVYRISLSDVVVSMQVEGAPKRMCVLAYHKPLLGAWTITDITPTNAPGLSRPPVLADLNNNFDKCPDLINNDGGANGLRRWTGSMTAGGCTLATLPGMPMGAPLQSANTQGQVFVVGRIPLDPPFLTYANDLLVMSDGVYAYDPPSGNFGRAFEAQRRLIGADHADLDGDGLVDGILIPATEDDLEILLRRPNSIITYFPGYLVLRIDTASRVVDLEIGDFDGNSHLDLGIVEQLTDHQRMVVAYGTSDLFLPPTTVGIFDSVISLGSLGLFSIDDFGGNTEDIFVLQAPPPGTSTTILTLLHGSVQRTMTAFFDPRPDVEGPTATPREATQLRDVFAGRFVGSSAQDLASIAVSRSDQAAQNFLWTVAGLGDGPETSQHPGVVATGFADCAGGESGLCIRDASYLAWPIAIDRDVVIAIDHAPDPHAVMFDPSSTGTVGAKTLAVLMALFPPMSIMRSMHVVDFDGDGTQELLVAMAPRPGTTGTGALIVCQMAGGTPTTCENLTAAVLAATQAIDQPATSCVDAAPARIAFRGPFDGPRTAQDLVVVCRGDGSALYRVSRENGALVVTFLQRTPASLQSIRVGDVTGDRVEDILAIEGESGAQSLIVFPQCSSRNLAPCGQATGGAP